MERARGLRILLVEDNLFNQELLGVILTEAGVELEIADNGAEAVRRVTEGAQAPDVVLMDIRMPVLDGVEATRRIRALPDPPAVVILTAFETDDFVLGALTAGAAGFLLKHTPPADLVAGIHQAAAVHADRQWPVIEDAVLRRRGPGGRRGGCAYDPSARVGPRRRGAHPFRAPPPFARASDPCAYRVAHRT